MIYIAHRGLIDGPNIDLENNPEHIDSIVKLGFDAEIHFVSSRLSRRSLS